MTIFRVILRHTRATVLASLWLSTFFGACRPFPALYYKPIIRKAIIERNGAVVIDGRRYELTEGQGHYHENEKEVARFREDFSDGDCLRMVIHVQAGENVQFVHFHTCLLVLSEACGLLSIEGVGGNVMDIVPWSYKSCPSFYRVPGKMHSEYLPLKFEDGRIVPKKHNSKNPSCEMQSEIEKDVVSEIDRNAPCSNIDVQFPVTEKIAPLLTLIDIAAKKGYERIYVSPLWSNASDDVARRMHRNATDGNVLR